MRPKDIFLYLLGNRQAIERIAGSWWSLLVGAVLILSSGIARNYDHLDLLDEPEWLYGPLLASFVTSLVVFPIARRFLGLGKLGPYPEGSQYWSFLGLYWMTAPCAWLYAVPVESFTDLLTATKWNIAFLATVSLWRVALMTRALAVLTRASAGVCLLAVLFPASVIMCVASHFKGMSLVGIMGGVRLPPHTQLLRDAANVTTVASFWVAVITFVITIMVLRRSKRAQKTLPWRKEKPPTAALVTALVIVAIGAVLSVPRQRLVQRNHHLETLLQSGDYTGAIRYASRFEKSDFSTIHYFPPSPFGIYGAGRTYHHLLSELDGSEPAWLREVWIQQYTDALLRSQYGVPKEMAETINRTPDLKAAIMSQVDETEHVWLLEDLREAEASSPEPAH